MTFIVNSATSTSPQSPVFDYSSRDYSAVYADLLARIPVYLPEWTSQSMSDFGIVVLQMFAYTADLLAYYLDRLAGEAFLATATQSSSIINLASMLDYQPSLSVGSTVNLVITLSPNFPGVAVIPAGTVFTTQASVAQSPIPFVTTEEVTIVSTNNATPGSGSAVVTAIQGSTYTDEEVASSNGAINQAYQLLNKPVSAQSPTVSVDLGTGPQEWSYITNLINAGPYDTVFTGFVDSSDNFYIIFGDGVNGYVPPLGSPITCTYMTNVGALGNVGANTITQPATALSGVAAVSNPAAASGGAYAESLASIQQNAPASLTTLNRAISTSDIEVLASQVSGVEWISVVQQTYQLVNLFVVPYGGGSPSAFLQQAIQTALAPALMANTTVTIVTPTIYIPINVSVTVEAYPNYGNDTVEAAVTAALSELLDISNTGFGFRVGLGLVYQIVLAVPGVNYAIVTGLTRMTLTDALVNNSSYTELNVVELASPVSAGDNLIINPGYSTTQTVVASADAGVGATVIEVNAFTANDDYSVGIGVQDSPSPSDVVALDNEAPIAGSFLVDVTGGYLEST
jgi:uncharacterized phage protein gp47/JayE